MTGLDPIAVRARAEAALQRSAELTADLEERRARCLAGETPDEWQAPPKPEPVMSRAVQPQPAPVAVMPAETQAAWDRWAKAHIRNALRAWEKKRQGTMDKGVADAIGQVFAHERRAMRDHVGAKKAQLLCRIMALEAERAGRSVSHVSTKGRGNGHQPA